MTEYKFTVDAQLLRELGERLVGQPHVALAELIKNSYDADATRVEIDFTGDQIVVSDNGHGMSESDFATRWMRVGTAQKRNAGISPNRGRVLTGSKGVGRLAAQLLARKITVSSVALTDPAHPETSGLDPAIEATVDWDEAIEQDALTSVAVDVVRPAHTPTFPAGARHGTIVSLEELTEVWGTQAFSDLAGEIWALTPPYAVDPNRKFEVVLKSEAQDVEAAFVKRMNAIFKIWNAKIKGRLLPREAEPSTQISGRLPARLPTNTPLVAGEDENEGEGEGVEDRPSEPWNKVPLSAKPKDISFGTRYLQLTVTLRDESERTTFWEVNNCQIDQVDFEILVFDLVRRQPDGIRVNTARNYLQQFGGVGLYDNDFRLPFYGGEEDWLRIEHDFAGRRLASQLLPEELQVRRGLLDLPSNRRLFGWVSVSTNHEAQTWAKTPAATEALSIQVTRDRLADNAAYQRLRVMVRTGIDLYAMEKARSKIPAFERVDYIRPEPPSNYVHRVSERLSELRPRLEPPVYIELKTAVDEAVQQARSAEVTSSSYAALLGALATAGMTSLAYEHEMSKQVAMIAELSEDLEDLLPELDGNVHDRVEKAAAGLKDWQERVSAIRQIFTPLLRAENRDKRERFLARDTVLGVAEYMESLARQAPVDASGVPDNLHLPRATYPAWSSVFQNVLLNAFNALHNEPDPRVIVDGGGDDRNGWIRVMDNGVGVDLDEARNMFRPFERRLVLPKEIEDAGLGGMGLGLTIVRMVLDDVGVEARFVPPPAGMSTALLIEWRNKR